LPSALDVLSPELVDELGWPNIKFCFSRCQWFQSSA
jgi:hypothetical protein